MSGHFLEMVNNGDYDSSEDDDIGNIIVREKEGRKSEDEIIIFMT